MGSLMAGWDAPVLDPDTARIERNKSLTQEEIRAFQRLHECSQHDGKHKGFTVLKSSDIYELLQKSEVEEGNRTADWWTKSDWAFLNEPPLDETGKTYNYASQFHVAEIATKKDL
ncbi:hypothetical protein KFK09_015436 [Dendrobium nobile]|uniref:Uncharacterized protein n=1 Tax=Dendrobium nobile TaxID=94219 RepID=A0A8T3B4T1_DENNO|nr:hypothetical protein KFK09_015436 [Dendrobium nobile]